MLKSFSCLLGICLFAFSAGAQSAKPDMVCWETQTSKDDLEILLTKSEPLAAVSRTKIEIFQKKSSPEKQLLAVRESSLIRQPSSELYRGDGLSLEISLESTFETGERAAQLILQLEKGTEITKDLLCDSLQYSAGEAQASY